MLLTARVFRNSFEISEFRSHSYSYNFGLSWPFSKQISKLVDWILRENFEKINFEFSKFLRFFSKHISKNFENAQLITPLSPTYFSRKSELHFLLIFFLRAGALCTPDGGPLFLFGLPCTEEKMHAGTLIRGQLLICLFCRASVFGVRASGQECFCQVQAELPLQSADSCTTEWSKLCKEARSILAVMGGMLVVWANEVKMTWRSVSVPQRKLQRHMVFKGRCCCLRA